MDLLQYTFFQHALLGSLLASIACGIIGTYIVTRRLVFISGGITHASFGGIGLGLFAGISPILSAAVFSVLSAFGVEWLSRRKDMREDSAIAVFWTLGMALGNGWLFPGTYSRLESFRRGAKRGLKIVIGTVPVFIMAGFIEGFITRHTELPDMLRLGIILTSLAFIIFYYIYLPNRKKHGITET